MDNAIIAEYVAALQAKEACYNAWKNAVTDALQTMSNKDALANVNKEELDSATRKVVQLREQITTKLFKQRVARYENACKAAWTKINEMYDVTTLQNVKNVEATLCEGKVILFYWRHFYTSEADIYAYGDKTLIEEIKKMLK